MKNGSPSPAINSKLLKVIQDLIWGVYLEEKFEQELKETNPLRNVQRLEVNKILELNSIKVRTFFGKNIKKKHLGRHDKNCYYFCKSDIPVITLILCSRNMIKVLKTMSL